MKQWWWNVNREVLDKFAKSIILIRSNGCISVSLIRLNTVRVRTEVLCYGRPEPGLCILIILDTGVMSGCCDVRDQLGRFHVCETYGNLRSSPSNRKAIRTLGNYIYTKTNHNLCFVTVVYFVLCLRTDWDWSTHFLLFFYLLFVFLFSFSWVNEVTLKTNSDFSEKYFLRSRSLLLVPFQWDLLQLIVV